MRTGDTRPRVFICPLCRRETSANNDGRVRRHRNRNRAAPTHCKMGGQLYRGLPGPYSGT